MKWGSWELRFQLRRHRNGLVNEKDMLWNVWQWKRYALERLARREKGVLRAAHTYTVIIRECPPPPGPNYAAVTPSRKSPCQCLDVSFLPGPHSHRTKGYLCSFPITWTPPPLLSRPGIGFNTIGNYWEHPLFRDFLENLPETKAKIYPLSQENGNTHAAPSCIRVEGGGALSGCSSSSEKQ